MSGWLARFYQSTIGQKIVMAVTGIVLVGFITVHMIGNLLVHKGAAAMNGYAALLKSNRRVGETVSSRCHHPNDYLRRRGTMISSSW